ncbi:MAG: APC family permease [Polyangiaceae bacterium]
MRQRSPELGFWSLCALGVNGMVGVGIFFAPAKVAALVPGSAGTWVYALTTLAIAPVAACYALLGARFDRDGGPFVWAQAAFGGHVAYAVGWISYVSAVFSTAAVVSGLGQYLGPYLGFVGAANARLFSTLSVMVLGLLVAAGLRLSAWVWNGLTVAKLVPLVALLALGAALWWRGSATAASPPNPAAAPLDSPASTAWLRASLVALFATQGFEILPVPSGSIRRRSRNLPLAMLASLSFVTLLYMGLHATAVRALPDVARTEAPLVEAANALGGARLDYLVALGTQVSAVGIAFGMFAMTPRYLAALAGPEGLGEWIGRHSGRNVPLPALLITLASSVALVLSGKLESLFVLASMAVLAQFAVSLLALCRLAWRTEHGLVRAHLWLGLPALGSLGLVARGAERRELLVLFASLALGLLLRYLPRGRGPKPEPD